MPKLSVIVPVYNVKEYLGRCLDSILRQTFSDFELILVDDGSADGSAEICDIYAEKDARVRVIHQSNSGQGMARNTGLRVSTGEYIGFVDSDDWIACDMYEHLVSILQHYGCDVAETGCRLVGRGSPNPRKSYRLAVVPGGDGLLEQYLLKGLEKPFGGYSVCIKLYRAHLFSGVSFSEECVCEDYLINFQLLQKARKAVFSNKESYFYAQRQESTIRGMLSKKDFSMLTNCIRVRDLAAETGNGRIVSLAETKVARCYFSLLAKAYRYGVGSDVGEDDLEEIKRRFDENYAKLLLSPIPLNRKLIMTGLLINNRLNLLRVRRGGNGRNGR
jgi:glycosyltransferase involved in cell wall biosynthesis